MHFTLVVNVISFNYFDMRRTISEHFCNFTVVIKDLKAFFTDYYIFNIQPYIELMQMPCVVEFLGTVTVHYNMHN